MTYHGHYEWLTHQEGYSAAKNIPPQVVLQQKGGGREGKMDNKKWEKEKEGINARQRRREHREWEKLSMEKRAALVYAKQEMEVTAEVQNENAPD